VGPEESEKGGREGAKGNGEEGRGRIMEIVHPIISIKKFHCGIGVCINLGPNVHYETVEERRPYDLKKTIFA